MKQYTFKANKQFVQVLKMLSNQMGVGDAETIRRAIALLKVATDETQHGRHLITEKHDGTDKKELILT